MIKLSIKYIIFIFSVLVFISCENNNNTEIQKDLYGKQFFPLTVGNTLIYKITHINIDAPSEIYDTTIYYLKEIVESYHIDNESDTAYRIERYTSPDKNHWTINQIWSAKRTTLTAEKVEENQRIVKLRFPVAVNQQWNGNLFNNLDAKIFKIRDINFNYSIDNQQFEDCVLVVHDSLLSLVYKNYECEIYAKNIGLIYKEITHISSQIINPLIMIENRAKILYVLKQELIEMRKI